MILRWWRRSFLFIVVAVVLSTAAKSRKSSNIISDSIIKDYYDQFELDYGCEDNVRVAGAVRGLIKTGSLTKLPQKDLFLKWLHSHLEKGNEPIVDRLKPFYVCNSGLNCVLIAMTSRLLLYRRPTLAQGLT